jgi:hypothetical protein
MSLQIEEASNSSEELTASGYEFFQQPFINRVGSSFQDIPTICTQSVM